MNDSHPTNEQVQNLGTAALLRCAADDELTPQQRAALDAHLAANPEDAARIRFERDLRGACARVMGEGAVPSAPPALRALIAARISPASPASTSPSREPEVVVGRILPGVMQRWGLLAATLVVAGLGVGLLVRAGMLTSGTGGEASAAVVLTSFLADEHQQCSKSDSDLTKKFKVTDLARVPNAVQQVLGKPVSVESMTAAGFEFVGAGTCRVPEAEKSYHLMFRRPSKSGKHPGTPVSLFIEPDNGRLNLEEGVTYAVDEGGGGNTRVIAWTHDGLVYYLVTQCSASCEAARDGLAAPSCIAGLAR